jgi:K+-transporting ATPase ATPase A chain
MTTNGWLQIAAFTLLVALLVRPLGGYMSRVFCGEPTALGRLLGPVERGIYRLAGVDATAEQSWLGYALALIAFNAMGVAALYAVQRLQSVLPLNPQNLPAVAPELALNTAVSFASNTSWQSYAGETTLGYLAQMAGITVSPFSPPLPASPSRLR